MTMQLLLTLGRVTEALAELDRATELDSRQAWIHWSRADALATAGRVPEAVRYGPADRRRMYETLNDQGQVTSVAGAGVFAHALGKVRIQDIAREGGFACSGRAHNGDELSFLDVDVHTPENEGFGWAVLEILLDATETDHRDRWIGL